MTKKSVKQWIKEHKTEITIGGITAVATIGAIAIALMSKNGYEMDLIAGTGNTEVPKDALEPIDSVVQFEEVADKVRRQIKMTEPFQVESHIRKLPNDWNASPEKVQEAIDLGIKLRDHETLVDGYMKNVA